MSIAESMKVTLFTPRQLAYGHTIKYYDKLVQSLSFERRQQIAELTKDDALLSRDERREFSSAPDATNNDDTDADAPDKKEGDTDVE